MLGPGESNDIYTARRNCPAICARPTLSLYRSDFLQLSSLVLNYRLAGGRVTLTYRTPPRVLLRFVSASRQRASSVGESHILLWYSVRKVHHTLQGILRTRKHGPARHFARSGRISSAIIGLSDLSPHPSKNDVSEATYRDQTSPVRARPPSHTPDYGVRLRTGVVDFPFALSGAQARILWTQPTHPTDPHIASPDRPCPEIWNLAVKSRISCRLSGISCVVCVVWI